MSSGAVNMLRNSQAGIYVYPVVAAEFSNWRSEQMAWRNSAVLFDQTHHMDELTVEGPDAEKFLSYVGINSFANFKLNVAKHFVPVTPAGHVIGDMIIFRETDDKFVLVGRAPTANWVMFQASIGSYNIRLKHDPRSDSRPDGKAVFRTHYRFQIQGPDAGKIFEQMNGGPIPEVKFFHVDKVNIGSREVMALRHGMSGAPGLALICVWLGLVHTLPTPLKVAGFLHLCQASIQVMACWRITVTGWVLTAMKQWALWAVHWKVTTSKITT